jgi:WD40 repeat protein/serine/threonine protein kinase
MNAERWQQIQDVFEEALQYEMVEREAFVAQTCAGDLELLAEVKLLLAHDAAAEGQGFLPPAGPLDEWSVSAAVALNGAAMEPRLPPGYELVCELGRGGMGVVYKARQTRLNRIVAVKLIRPGTSDNPNSLPRFLKEAEAAGRLNHPHIVQIYESGDLDGQPYFSMEFVDGRTLAQTLANTPQPAQEAARLLQILAVAVDYAHEQGVIHRDLTPGNILLHKSEIRNPKPKTQGPKREQPDLSDFGFRISDFSPKITDFGLAKLLDPEQEAAQTRTGDVVGTPAYMAPEQAIGKAHDVGPAVDIYALGAVLYETLTGRPPFKGATVLDTLEQVRMQEPVSPSRLQPKVPRDLDTICLKCLEKDPRQRYASTGALGDDLRRFLAGAPIQARPVSLVERLRRWCKRQPGMAALISVVVLLLVLWSASATFLAVWALNGEHNAKENEERAREATLLAGRLLYDADVGLTRQAWEEAQMDRLNDLLDGQRPERTGGIDRRGFEWYFWNRLGHSPAVHTFTGHTDGVLCVVFSPDGKHLASSSRDKTIRVWDLESRELRFLLQGHKGSVYRVAFSPDGHWLASASGDHTVKVWDLTTGKEPRTFTGHGDQVNCVDFSPDGSMLASASHDRTIRLWEWPSGRPLRDLPRRDKAATCVAFSPDRERLASAWVNVLSIWNLRSGKEEHHWEGHDQWITALALSVGGRRLASASWDQTAKVWDFGAIDMTVPFFRTREGSVKLTRMRGRMPELLRQATFRAREGKVNSVAFHPAGDHLAFAADDRTVRICGVSSQDDFTLTGHRDAVRSVAYSPDGKQLASASLDGTVKLWTDIRCLEPLTIKGHTAWINSLAFSADGRRLASAAGSIQNMKVSAGEVKVWDAATGRELFGFSQGAREAALCVAFDPQRTRLASAGGGITGFPIPALSGNVKVWDTTTGERAFTLTGHQMPVTCVTYSPDGKRLATSSLDQTVRVWDAAGGQKLRCLRGDTGAVLGVAYSPDGGRLASVSGRVEIHKDPQGGSQFHFLPGEITFWDATTGDKLLTFPGPRQFVFRLAFSPDGRLLATVGGGFENGEQSRHLGEATVWDAATGEEKFSFQGHTDWVLALAFSPDGRRLATGSADQTVRLWDLSTGQEVLTLRRHEGNVHALAFSPDGYRLASAGQDKIIRIWDGTPIGNQGPEKGASTFSQAPDEKR